MLPLLNPCENKTFRFCPNRGSILLAGSRTSEPPLCSSKGSTTSPSPRVSWIANLQKQQLSILTIQTIHCICFLTLQGLLFGHWPDPSSPSPTAPAPPAASPPPTTSPGVRRDWPMAKPTATGAMPAMRIELGFTPLQLFAHLPKLPLSSWHW